MKHFILILLFTILSFSQSNDYYLKNKIERKIHPLAWESHDINETLELLYGKNRLYVQSEEIKINLSANTKEFFDSYNHNRVTIRTNKKVKSIAILHKKEEERALIALFHPHSSFRRITLPLKMLNASITKGIKGMNVVLITETEDNHLFINTYPIEYSYFCYEYYLEELKEELNNYRLKTKYQINHGHRYFKFQIIHPMVSYNEAEKLKSKVNFISHIKVKKLFDLYTSEYIGRNPLIRIKFEDRKQDDNIRLYTTTINREVKTKDVVAKVYKK